MVRVGDVSIHFDRGESIWTEASYKYSLPEFGVLAAAAGWHVNQVWTR